ncbi:hypothetical protein SPYAA216_1238 [Streptococcus pyogenes AA216]|nr:hypothetical protein SPYAA216_1238 [Streptococcus pyogenes AA216]
MIHLKNKLTLFRLFDTIQLSPLEKAISCFGADFYHLVLE